MQNLWDPFCSPRQWEGGVYSNTSWKLWAELQCLAQSQEDPTAAHFSVKWSSSPWVSQSRLVPRRSLARLLFSALMQSLPQAKPGGSHGTGTGNGAWPWHWDVLGQRGPAHVGELSHGAAASAGQTALETLTLLPHIPSGPWLEFGYGWVHESVSLKQKELAQVFSEGVKGGLRGESGVFSHFLHLVCHPPLRSYLLRV